MAYWNFVVYLALALLKVSSAQMTNRYEVDSSFVNKTCSIGSILLSHGPMSRTKCAVKCQSHDSCIGIVYKTSEELCVLCSTKPTEVTSGTQFYRPQRRCGDTCIAGQIDCTEANQACIEGVCACVPGHMYNFTIHSCVTACTAYGTTFQKHQFSCIYSNDIFQSNVPDVSSCMQLCVSRTTECLSFDFDLILSICLINGGNALDLAAHYHPCSSYDYYDRNCLEP